MMGDRHRQILAFALLALSATDVRAHFLFARIGPMAEGGRTVEVAFSEYAEAGDPRLIGKIAKTRLKLQTKPGVFAPLELKQGPDRLRATLPTSGSLGVIGVCDYGVLSRPGKPAFLLRYYPKAIDGAASDLNALKPIGAEVPLEITANVSDKAIRFVVLRDGKPVPNAKLTTIDADLTNVELTADAAGTASWTPPEPGAYEVYASETLPTSGTHEGSAYTEIREFATLAFRWPVARSGADPEAVTLFEKAIADRAQWHEFPGFKADVTGDFDGRPFAGTVEVAKDGNVTSKVDDVVAKKWLEGRIHSLVIHRLADSGVESTPVVRFADANEDHPMGRLLLFEGGRFASSYRIKDGKISVVNRHIGASNMTITTLGNDRNPEGKALPTSYIVHYWDAASGALSRVETVQDRWTRVGSLDLPAEHVASTAASGGLSVRAFTLSKHALVK